MSKKYEAFIYPEKIRKYEKAIIDFIIESGKNKRKSDIESHILGYFLLHSSLTQKEIQILSTKFRSRRISSGSVSNFLKQYTSYEPKIILKRKVPNSKNKFRYHIISENLREMFAVGKEAGVNVLYESIRKINDILRALENLHPIEKEVNLYNIILERTKELATYLEYHLSLLDNFMETIIGQEYPLKKGDKIYNTNSELKKTFSQNLNTIEQEIINFVLNSELFIIEEVKYHPIIAYLITRKRLTQLELQKLTGLSAGRISEGLNYLKKEGYITIQKLQRERQRRYILKSIGYFNFFKFYKRFRNIAQNKYKLMNTLDEIKKRKDELEELNGYKILKKRIEEFLDQFKVIDFGIQIFQKALADFKKLE